MVCSHLDNTEINTVQLWIIQATGQMKIALPVSHSSARVVSGIISLNKIKLKSSIPSVH